MVRGFALSRIGTSFETVQNTIQYEGCGAGHQHAKKNGFSPGDPQRQRSHHQDKSEEYESVSYQTVGEFSHDNLQHVSLKTCIAQITL